MAETTQVLVLMPMLPGYEKIRETVANIISDSKLRLIWLEELLEDWEWLDWLYSSVKQCDLIVANPSKHNAFVMYELGIARQYNRPTIIMLDDDDSQLTGSLDGSPFLPYSNSKKDNFARRFRIDLGLVARMLIKDPDLVVDLPECYRIARHLADCFADKTGQFFEQVDEAAFNVRLNHSLSNGTFCYDMAHTPLGKAALLSAIVRSSRMVNTMNSILDWVDHQAQD